MTSKPIAVLVFLLMLTSALLGQTTPSVSGTVKDPTGAVVPGAAVILFERTSTISIKTVTGAEGRYSFDHLASGQYLLTASADGLKSPEAVTVRLAAAPKSGIDLRLQIVASADTVTVTASGTAQTATEVAKSVSLVSGETIDNLDSATISDTLNYVPGLRVEQEGGPGGFVAIRTRGLRNQDTAVLLDGFRLRDATSTQGDATGLLQDLLVSNVDHIEVLRGTASSIYGTDATGGVINIVTGDGGGKNRGSVLLEGGSMDTFRGRAMFAGSALSSRLGYSLGLAHYNVVGGLDGNLPARTSAAQGQLNLAASSKTHVFARFLITDSFSKLTNDPESLGSSSGTGSIGAVANVTFTPDTDDPASTRAARHYSGALIASTQLTDSLTLSADYQGLATHRGYNYGPYVGISNFDGMLNTASGRADWLIGKHQSINAGYEFENENFADQTLAPTAAGNNSANVTQRNQAFFVQDQLHLLKDRLQLAASYRVQFFSMDIPVLEPTTGAPYSGMTFSAPPKSNTWDVSSAYLFRESGTKLRAHVGTGYRAPSLYERFGTYYDSVYGYFAEGDPRLKPERSFAVDGGIEKELWNRKALASATYFYTRLNEVIVYGSLNGAADPFGRYSGYYNTHGGISRGVEASFTVSPVKSLNLRTSYTFTNARETTPVVAGIYQTFVSPDHQFSLLATERVTPRFTLIFGTVLTSSYLAPLYNSMSYADQAFRFNGKRNGQAGASYRFPLGESTAVRTFVNVNNAFHQTYYESGFRTPGTTAMSGLQFEF